MTDSVPQVGPRQLFAERFALLYAEAGNPPLKRVIQSIARAGRVDEQGRPVQVSGQRISDWRRGNNVPARFVVLAAVLEVLIGQAGKLRPTPAVTGLYEMGTWRAWWEAALTSPASADDGAAPLAGTASGDGRPDSGAGVCPYPGLAPFHEAESGWFFGRDRSTRELLAKISSPADTNGIVALVGASGAGKSSLLRAGLVPAIMKDGLVEHESDRWSVSIMTPGEFPMKELASRIPSLAESSGRLVLIVDQFEEIFTLCDDEQARALFIHTLGAICRKLTPEQAAPGIVLIGVRADFYDRCLAYPELTDALQNRQIVLGPMTAAELRDAVAKPAKAVGLQLELGLVDLVLRDMGIPTSRARTGPGDNTYDAGALPLLSHALLGTWQRRQAGKLTIAGYRDAGGIHGAVAATAERAWAELGPARQSAARLVLLHLVRLNEDAQDTRKRSTRQELVEQADDPTATLAALEVLAKARLVTLDDGSVEITHEALLHAWPRLRSWIDQDRAGNLARQRLEEDAKVWDGASRDASMLYRGTRLATSRQWAKSADRVGLSGTARDFLTVSTRHRRRIAWAARTGVVLLVVLATIATIAATTAVKARNDAQFAQVVAEANQLQVTNPSLAAQLDLVAHNMRPDDPGVDGSILSTQNAPLATPLVGHTGAVYLTSFSPNGHVLATASFDKTVRLWDVTDPTRPEPLGRPLTGHTSWVSSAVFSPNGRTLATAGDDGTVQLWDVTDPAHATAIGPPFTGHDGTISLVAFSPDGRTLAAADQDDTVRLWNLTDLHHPTSWGQPLTGHTAAVRSVAFSPDGHTLAAGSDDTTVRLWNVTDPADPRSLGGPLTGHTATVHSVAFSPDGQILVTGSEDRTARLWNVSDPADPTPIGAPLVGHFGGIWSVSFGPDGNVLATGSEDGTTRLWDLSDPTSPVQLGQPLSANGGGVFAVSFSPDGRTLAAGSADGITRLWNVPRTVLTGHQASVLSAVFSQRTHLLASTDNNGTIRLWNVADPADPTPVGAPFGADTEYADSPAFSPDGRILATASGDSTVRLWDVADPAQPRPLGPPITVNTRYGNAVAFSPSGRVLATTITDETIQLWSLADPAHPTPLGLPLTGHTGYVNSLMFSPNGRTLASASSDNTVRLWNVADPAHVTPLGPPIAGGGGQVHQAVFSPDGRVLATANDNKTVLLFNVADPAHPTPLGQPLTGATDVVGTVAFSPDGHTLVAGSADKTVQIWTLPDPDQPPTVNEQLSGHTGSVGTVAFSPDGRTLVTGSPDETVQLWSLDLGDAIQRICATTRDVLTPQQWQQQLPQLAYAPPCA